MSIWRGLTPVTALSAACAVAAQAPAEPPHPVMTWVKRHPVEAGDGKPSPRLGYETSYGYDRLRRILIRYGGHNQGGGGEQNSEVWTYDLDADVWTLKEPNDAPPGVCCAQQNVFDEAARKLIRFPAFSGSHGWQTRREINLKDSSVWTYALDTNTWANMRPLPQPPLRPLRGAAYDPHHQVVVVHGGEGARHSTVVYDPHANTWHWMKPDPAPPASISQPGMCYDPVNRLFVLFGSQFASDPRTWVYDLRKNQWRELEVEEHPPADKTCPVLAADSRSGIVLACVNGPDGPETWALDVANSVWRRLRPDQEPDPAGGRARILLYLPDRNLFVLENRTKDEQQIWTFRYAEAPAPASGPRDLRVMTDTRQATLTWRPPPTGENWRYEVHRAEGPVPWRTQWRRIAAGLRATTFQDTGIPDGALYYYQVHAVDGQGRETAPSLIRCTQPAVVRRLWVSVLDPSRVELTWAHSSPDDIVGYHVERADVRVYSTDQVLRIKERFRHTSGLAAARVERIGAFRRLTARPLTAPRFVDADVDFAAGQQDPAEPPSGGGPLPAERLDAQGEPYRYAVYAYRVIAVNRLGVESGPSPCRFSYPSAVQHVFAREAGDDSTELKWRANPEKGIKGYLVYRHDGRWNSDTVSRLTPEPIPDTTFTDATAGQRTRRYEIVAVDVLGQQGEPSQPVWSRREWRKFYIPYVQDWHQ